MSTELKLTQQQAEAIDLYLNIFRSLTKLKIL